MGIRRAGGQKAPQGKDPMDGAGLGYNTRVGSLGGGKGAYGPGGQGPLTPVRPRDDSRTHPPEVEPAEMD